MLIPEAAEKISGKSFLIYKAIAALRLTSRLLSSGVNLGTFHKQNLDIYSEGNLFIKKQETTAELMHTWYLSFLSPSGDLGIGLVWDNRTTPPWLFGPTVEILFKLN